MRNDCQECAGAGIAEVRKVIRVMNLGICSLGLRSD